jgi:DNA-binding CsgD family transcriptional regulator
VKNAETVFRSLNSLQVSAAILDRLGKIIAVNESWTEFGAANGLQIRDCGVGLNYLDYCDTRDAEGRQHAANLRGLLAGDTDMVTLLYPCHSPSQQRWFFMLGIPLALDELAGVALLHINLSNVVPLLFDNPPRGEAATTNGPGVQAERAGLVSAAMLEGVANTLSAQLTGMLAAAASRSATAGEPAASPVERLSKRQMEVFRLLGRGFSNAEIAQTLLRSPHTVKLHVSAILQRLNLKNRTQAALLGAKLAGHAPGGLASTPRDRSA